MAQTHRVSRNNTTIKTHNGTTSITLHHTVVVAFNDSSIMLDCGGYRTVTTRTRMNQASHQYALGYGVSFAGGDFTVRYKGHTHHVDGNSITLQR